jgi:hypothetical protein
VLEVVQEKVSFVEQPERMSCAQSREQQFKCGAEACACLPSFALPPSQILTTNIPYVYLMNLVMDPVIFSYEPVG